ncbi:MAG: hypothetical protein KME28_23795 [Pelatocladus maniniholoensis HA4357-MV3]|jgi:hypothetical protein|uniref:Uncharacterized protein n=1 Tax=Pelatocladus maniniholoensis HA4357-MV3 TaxID=1117104 RepID=A0A9E3LUZ8_9NOST|nr:hypothetical protein [Pelatocladus maniniholoensis HA4357-MV3]
MITIDEIVSLLQSRNFTVDPKELQLFKTPRVKLPNDYYLKFYPDPGSGEYEACITHKSICQTTWRNIDVHSLTLALDYVENILAIAPKTSIEQTPTSVIEPVQQSVAEHSSSKDPMPLIATAFAIACVSVIASIGIVSVNLKSCNSNITQPVQLPVKKR